MAKKREAPYTRLRRKAREMAEKVVNPRTRTVIQYLEAREAAGVERTLFDMAMALNQAGYDLVLRAEHSEGRLVCLAVERHGVTYVPSEFWD